MERKLKSGYNSNSFDRFGDDLCQLILSYLPLRYKLLFECVSKQWRQLIFNEQKLLIIGRMISFKYNYINLPNCVLSDQNYQNIIFEKFKFIREIKIYMGLSNEMLLSIMNNCQYLESIRIMDIMDDNFIQTILKKTSNNFNNDGLTQIHLPKLEVIDILFPDIMSFTDMYWNQIKKMKITIRLEFTSDQNNDMIIANDLKQLSRFVNLESLDITLRIYKPKHKICIDECFSDIAIKCTKLKNLKFHSRDYLRQNVLKVLGNFVNLENLLIDIEYHYNANRYGRVEDLKDCIKLKYLEIRAYYMTDYHLYDIHTYLPQLNSFISTFGYSSITDISVTSFSKLKYLKQISFRSDLIRNDCLISMIKDCPELQHIKVYNVKLTKDLIQALIKKAVNNPKKMFYFNFDENPRKSDFDISIYKQLPKNLKSGTSVRKFNYINF